MRYTSKTVALLVGICCAAWAATAARSAEPAITPQAIAPPTRIPGPVDTTPAPRGTPVTTSTIPREVRRALVADAARRFNVASNAVVLGDAEMVSWHDDSLGCPEPGRSYAREPVAGYRVVARTSAGALLYHTDMQGRVVNCARLSGGVIDR